MPRVLSKETYELRIQDNISGSELVFYYRMPTTQERIAYQNEGTQRIKNKLVFRTGQTRQKFGAKILRGIRKDDFIVEKDGKPVDISSMPDWKELIEEHAMDLVELLAAHVFENSAEALEDAEDVEKN